MIHSPIQLPDSIDHQCSNCAQIERAPAQYVPNHWLVMLASDPRSQTMLCSDCAPAVKAAALDDIQRQTLPIVRGTCRPTLDDAVFAKAQVKLVDDLGFDEIDRVSLVIECEELFGIHLSDGDVSQINTIDDLNRAVFAKKYTRSGSVLA